MKAIKAAVRRATIGWSVICLPPGRSAAPCRRARAGHCAGTAPRISGPARCSARKFGGQGFHGLHFGLRAQGFDLHGAARLHDALVGSGLREADVARDLVVRGVDGGERGFDFGRRIDAGDQRGIQNHAVTRGGGAAFVVHVLIQVAQILAQVVDRNAGHLAAGAAALAAPAFRARSQWHGLRLETGDALAQHGNEIGHHVDEGLLDAEDEGVEIGLADAVADLAGQSGVELIFGDRLQARAVFIGRGILQVERHVDGHGGDGDFVDLLPGHLEVRSAGRDDAYLRIGIARAFLGAKSLGDGVVERGLVAGDADGPAEARFDGALVLIDGIHAHQKNAQDEPGAEADEIPIRICIGNSRVVYLSDVTVWFTRS